MCTHMEKHASQSLKSLVFTCSLLSLYYEDNMLLKFFVKISEIVKIPFSNIPSFKILEKKLIDLTFT